MNAALQLIKADKIIRIAMTLSLLLIVLHLSYLAIFFLQLPPVVPLYNQLPWGEPRLGSKLEIFIPIAITTLFFGLNYILIVKLYNAMPLVSRMVGITTLLVSLVSFIFIVRTMQLIL